MPNIVVYLIQVLLQNADLISRITLSRRHESNPFIAHPHNITDNSLCTLAKTNLIGFFFFLVIFMKNFTPILHTQIKLGGKIN